MIRFAELETAGAACAVMSERADGDCKPPPGAAGSHRALVCEAAGVDPARLVLGKQVHGVRVRAAGHASAGCGARDWGAALPDTDGLVTDAPGLPLAVLVADCVPVFLYAPGSRCGGVIHAGRRGAEAGIAAAGLQTLVTSYGVQAADVIAVIGPSAGPCCYEVSAAVAQAWRAKGLPANGRHVDLWEANAQQLAKAGVPRHRIHVTGVCTICSGRFFSHRADASGKRNLALFMV